MPLFARAQSSPLPVPVPSKSPTTRPNVDGIPTALARSSRCSADLYRNNRGGLGSTGIEMWSPFTCYASSTHPLLAGGGRGYPAIGVWTPCRNSHPAFCPQLSTQSFPNPQFNSTLLFPKSWATQNFDNATTVETQRAEANREMIFCHIFLPDLFLILLKCQIDI